MPLLTMASAISRMTLSLTLQPNLFQLFHPMGGVGASKEVSERVDGASKATVFSRRNAPRKIRRGRYRKGIMVPRIFGRRKRLRSLARLRKECDAIWHGSRRLDPQMRTFLGMGCRIINAARDV